MHGDADSYIVYLSLTIPPPPPPPDAVELWDVEGKLQLKVVSAGNLNVGKEAKVSRNLIKTWFLPKN